MVVMPNFTFEICRKAIIVSRNEDTRCEWCDPHFAVRTHKGIHFYEFSHHLESLDKQLDCVESFVNTPTCSPSSDIFDCKLVRTGLKNRDMSDMMLDTAMWGHSDHLVHELTNVLAFEFSPPGLIRKKNCALAILNNIGYVALYIKGRTEWVKVLDISSSVKDQFEECLKQNPDAYSDLKRKAYNLATSSLCWAPKVKNNYCYFVTFQKSSILLFWLIQSQGEDIAAKFCGKIELTFDEAVHMKWIPKTENNFILIISNVLGQVMALECQINKKHVILLKSHMLWEHKDRMSAKFSQYHIEGDRILLLYNKHRHLVSQLIDESCRIIAQSVDNINDYRVTSIGKNSNQYYVTTINFKFYRINYSLKNDTLKITFKMIDIKDISPTMELHSVRFSINGVLCVLTAIDRRVMHKKDPLQMENIFIQVLPDITILDILFNNPTKQLTNYWDCIDLLRFKIVKTKMLPAIDFKVLLADGQTDIYKLKLYLIFVRIYRNLVSNIKMSDGFLPENSIESIKDKIFILHANSTIIKLFNKSVNGELLNKFEMECFAGCKKYLLNYSRKYEFIINDLATPDMLNLVTNEYSYTCQCCDEQIKDFSCQNGHANIFCSLSFTPIEDLDYLMCKYCNLLARIETYSERPLCVLCDSNLEMHSFCA